MRASWVLLVSGAGLLAWAGVTSFWQDPVTGIHATLEQRDLREAYETRLEEYVAAAPSAGVPTVRELPSARPEDRPPERDRAAPEPGGTGLEQIARTYRLTLPHGEPMGRILVPKLAIDLIVVNGATTGDLHNGPGRDLRSLMPGEGGLVYVAGHRTTWGAPFRHIDELRPGDEITLEVPYGRFTYRVTGHAIVYPDEVERLESRGREEIALQASHPPYSARQRFIVYGRLAAVETERDSR